MVKKSNDKIIWFAIGAVAMYFLKDHVQGVVSKVTGSMRARSYHVQNMRSSGLRGWQRPGFPGQGHAYGRRRRFQQFY